MGGGRKAGLVGQAMGDQGLGLTLGRCNLAGTGARPAS